MPAFQYPHLLWLLALVPVLVVCYLLYRRWQVAASKRLGNPLLVKKLVNGFPAGRATFRFVLFLLAVTLGVLALANPRTAGETEPDVRQGIDLLFAVDVSNSMRAIDISPDRLSAARNLVQQMIRERPDDRLGLVVFAGNAYLQLPLTYDHSSAEMLLQTLDPGMVPVQGTAINAALKTAQDAFGKDNKRYKVVVLVTDGETHDEEATETVAALAAGGIQLHTVGFGSPAGATIIDPATRQAKLAADGTPVISRLNEPLLQTLATSAKGKYFSGNDVHTTGKALLAELAGVKETAGIDPSFITYQSWYSWLLIPMLFLLVVEMFIPQRKKEVL